MESKVSRRLQQATAQEVCDHIYLPRLNREFSSGFDYLSDINPGALAHAGARWPDASGIGDRPRRRRCSNGTGRTRGGAAGPAA